MCTGEHGLKMSSVKLIDRSSFYGFSLIDIDNINNYPAKESRKFDYFVAIYLSLQSLYSTIQVKRVSPKGKTGKLVHPAMRQDSQ